MFLGETNDRKIVQTKPLQFAARGRELSFAAIDNNQVRKTNERSPVFFSDLDVGRWTMSVGRLSF